MEQGKQLEEQLQENLTMVHGLVEQGLVDQAIEIITIYINNIPQYKAELLYERAMIFFNAHKDREALLDFVELYYYSGNEDVFNLIYEAFIQPNEKYYEQVYKQNMRLLDGYPFVYGLDRKESENKIVWVDSECVIYYIANENRFSTCVIGKYNYQETVESAVFFCNPLSVREIQNVESKNRVRFSVNGRTVPLYVGFDCWCGEAFLQLAPIDCLLNTRRMVLFFNKESGVDFFSREDIILPQVMLGETEKIDFWTKLIVNEEEKKEKKFIQNKSNVEKYYIESGEKIFRNIQNKTPRILFYTSRFTTVLQYHVANLEMQAKREGLDTKVIIEEDNIFVSTKYVVMRTIYEFQPDILFFMDHFRFEWGNDFLPHNLVVLTWIQDPMPVVTAADTNEKLTNRDVILHYWTKGGTWFSSFNERPKIQALIPSSDAVYKKYDLTDEERQRYEADICLVCHASDADGYILDQMKMMPEYADFIESVYQAYFAQAYKGDFFYTEEEFHQLIIEYTGITEDKVVDFFAKDMHKWFNQRVFRTVITDWLLEAGYTNLKLWGSEWERIPRFKEYAMGVAENGVELSKVLQASKIVLGNNIGTTSAARVWETMLSGGFYISNYIPRDADWVDLRTILREGEEVDFFYDKKDLIKKVDYYLRNEDERIQKSKIAQEKAQQKMTFKVLLNKILEETPNVLRAQGAME